MNRGLLLIDGAKNTLLLSDEMFDDLLEYSKYYNKKWVKAVKRHRTKTELYNDITKYLNNAYDQEDIE